jgi:hypothetical protein
MPSPFFFSFFSFFIGVGVNYKSYFKKNKLEDIRGDNWEANSNPARIKLDPLFFTHNDHLKPSPKGLPFFYFVLPCLKQVRS